MDNIPTQITFQYKKYKYSIADSSEVAYRGDTQHLVNNFLNHLNKKKMGWWGRNGWYLIVPTFLILIGFYILTFIIGKYLLLVVPGVAAIGVTTFYCMTMRSIQAFKNAKKEAHDKHAPLLKPYYEVTSPIEKYTVWTKHGYRTRTRVVTIFLTPVIPSQPQVVYM